MPAAKTLTEILAEILEHCLTKGMQLPLTMYATGADGSWLTVRMRKPGIPGEVLSEQFKGGSKGGFFRLPATMDIVDKRGVVAHVEFDVSGPVPPAVSSNGFSSARAS
jgi:hypothetical protein